MSFTERFEWFVRGVITSASYARGGFADDVRDSLNRYGVRATLQRAGRGGMGREDWNDIAIWFLNARRD